MKAVYLGTEQRQFKENYKKAILDFYGNSTEIKSEDEYRIIFKIPFAQEYFTRALYHKTIIKIGREEDVSGTDIDTDFLFRKDNEYTTFTLLILKDNSITLLEGDSSSIYGGQSIYSILNTDKGLVFFGCCENPNNIEDCKSIHIESGKDLTPVTFGNTIQLEDNKILKQPFKLTDKDGEIYTALDVYNISLKNNYNINSNWISSWDNLSNKNNSTEKINTPLLFLKEDE